MSQCKRHEKDEPIEDGQATCPECGRLLSVRDCPKCGETFLDWTDLGYDDIVAAPVVASSGDLCCAACIHRVEADLARDEDDDSGLEFIDDDFDPEEVLD